jgi:hypothetical protein
MTILAKTLAIAVTVLFFMSAQTHKKPPLNWAVIGLVGYGLGWGITYGLFHVLNMKMGFMLMQVPALAGAAIAFLVRQKLIADAQ